MCGRFVIDILEDTLVEVFGVVLDPATPLEMSPSWNVAPGTAQVVVGRDAHGVRRAGRYTWGFVPSWAREDGPTQHPINARSETVARNGMFRAAWAANRCLVPATGFYEWQRREGGKQPYVFTVDGGAPFAFGGILSRTRRADGTIIRSFCLLTTEANEVVAPVHDRMPVIVEEGAWGPWLAGEEAPPQVLEPLLRPFDAARMAARPVSSRVNRVAENDAGLLEPVEVTE